MAACSEPGPAREPCPAARPSRSRCCSPASSPATRVRTGRKSTPGRRASMPASMAGPTAQPIARARLPSRPTCLLSSTARARTSRQLVDAPADAPDPAADVPLDVFGKDGAGGSGGTTAGGAGGTGGGTGPAAPAPAARARPISSWSTRRPSTSGSSRRAAPRPPRPSPSPTRGRAGARARHLRQRPNALPRRAGHLQGDGPWSRRHLHRGLRLHPDRARRIRADGGVRPTGAARGPFS